MVTEQEMKEHEEIIKKRKLEIVSKLDVIDKRNYEIAKKIVDDFNEKIKSFDDWNLDVLIGMRYYLCSTAISDFEDGKTVVNFGLNYHSINNAINKKLG